MQTAGGADEAGEDALLLDARGRVRTRAAGTLTVEQAGHLDADAFQAHFGGVFEHSPWIARDAWATRPWASLSELHAALVGVVDAAPRERRLALLRAHPDLARSTGRSPALSAASSAEQKAAGLDGLDSDRGERLAALNRDYRARFGFPFIVCAREHTPASLLEQATARLGHEPRVEERTALAEVAKIARLRLEDLVGDGDPRA